MAKKYLLSDRACRAAKPGERVKYVNDGAGLRLRILPDGNTSWILRQFADGREAAIGLGSYPDVTLAEARDKADAIRSGVDVPTRRRSGVKRSAGDTFEDFAYRWLDRYRPSGFAVQHPDDAAVPSADDAREDKRKKWSMDHYERNDGILRRILLPDLARRPLAAITKEELLAVLVKHYDRTPESARRARIVACSIYQFAIDDHRVTVNVAAALAKNTKLAKPPVRNFRALAPADIGPFWLALREDVTLAASTKAALAFITWTAARDRTVRGANWSEIDLAAGVWTVDAGSMKAGREWRSPLPTQALAMLSATPKAERSGPLFVSEATGGPLAENTLRLAIHRLGFKVTAHGLRSVFASNAIDAGEADGLVELQLAHVLDATQAAYRRSDALELRRGMMQRWADRLDILAAK